MKKYILFAGLVMSMLGAASANASEMYTYDGNIYTSTYGSLLSSTNCGGVSCDSMTISFTVSSPLGDNFSGAVTPTSFAASNGAETITNLNSLSYAGASTSPAFSPSTGLPGFPTFDIVTNASGQIVQWAIALVSNEAPGAVEMVSISGIDEPGSSDPIDITDVWNYCSAPTCGEETFAGQDYTPGSWTPTNGPLGATPLPAALPLFASGLGALGLFGWRRKRKAQAAA